MAPEQARGKAVDKRADIWAFGCILYELLSGRPPFQADTVPETIGLIVARDIDMAALPAAVPRHLRTLIRRCLEKDPKRRLRDIGDAQLEISEHADADRPSAAPPAIGPWRTAAIVAAGAVLAAGVTWLAVRSPAPPAPAAKRLLLSGASHLLLDPFQALAVAPDAREFAFRGRGADGVDRLYVRALDELAATVVPGTEGGQLPFFSPDGQWLGFFAGRWLKRIALAGGAPQSLAPAVLPSGGTWMDDGSIVFTDARAGLQRIGPAGGPPERLLAVEHEQGGAETAAPWGLPGSRGVPIMVRRGTTFDVAVFRFGDRTLHVLAEDGTTRRGSRSAGRPSPCSPGWGPASATRRACSRWRRMGR
jgi:eukaryotic-like serine/threonine-protein kinase